MCLVVRGVNRSITMRFENKTIRLFLILFLLSGTGLFASDVLERTISVHFDKTPLKEALAAVAREGGFEW